MRTINFGTARSEDDPAAATFTLAYETRLDSGETVRMVRGLTASGVECVGRKLTVVPFDDDRIDNITVTDRDGADVTFGFACFSADEWPTGTPEQQRSAMALLTFVPPELAGA